MPSNSIIFLANFRRVHSFSFHQLLGRERLLNSWLMPLLLFAISCFRSRTDNGERNPKLKWTGVAKSGNRSVALDDRNNKAQRKFRWFLTRSSQTQQNGSLQFLRAGYLQGLHSGKPETKLRVGVACVCQQREQLPADVVEIYFSRSIIMMNGLLMIELL